MLKQERCEFSERMFEFAYNAEFCRKNSAFLVGAPSIPSQNLEKLLAYDVALRVKKGSPVRSLFLQHKVPIKCWVPNKEKTTSHYAAVLGRRYFRFFLNNQQHNKIIASFGRRSPPIYYCSPLFTNKSFLHSFFVNSTIQDNSILIDVSGLPELTGPSLTDSHSIGYDIKKSKVYQFSLEPKLCESVSADTLINRLPIERFNMQYLEQLLADVKNAVGPGGLDESEMERLSQPIPELFIKRVEEVAYWTSTKLGVSWLLIPQK